MFIQSFYQPSRSLEDRLFNAEFDDALVDQVFWKSPRYEGSRLYAKKINHYIEEELGGSCGIGCASITNQGPGIGEMVIGGGVGGITTFTVEGYYTATGTNGGQPPATNAPGVFQVSNFSPRQLWKGDSLHPAGLNPILKNETTALYIANTVIGGEEDPQFATLKKHSNININQILLINPITDSTQLLEKTSEPYEAFHRFITTDLPTAGSFTIKLIDESISHNLKGPNQYKIKMNKGFLLKSFDFKLSNSDPQLTENNTMYLYNVKGATSYYQDGGVIEGAENWGGATVSSDDYIRFRYGTVELLAGDSGEGHTFGRDRIGPSFASSSIIENKFTKIYYSGSFGLVNEPLQPQGTDNTHIIRTSGLGSASRFIGLNTLKYLRQNNDDPNLTNQEKTELHITFLNGEKDFSINEKNIPISGSANDERSIGTFEIDSNQDDLDVGGICNDYLPKTHEIRLKGKNDTRFEPRGHTYFDSFQNGYVTSSATLGGACVPIGVLGPLDNSYGSYASLQRGLNVDKVLFANVYIQGGILEAENTYLGAGANLLPGVGWDGIGTGSYSQQTSLLNEMSASNFYSSSFSYQLSFLDKDHTLISNVDKQAELFDGIGVKGIVIIPEYVHPKIKNNINYYLQQAGIIDSSPNTQVQLTNDIR